MVPVCDGYAWGNFDSHMVDCRDDLIMKYSTMRPVLPNLQSRAVER